MNLTIDYLKSCSKIHFFGLGFIQVKLNDSVRYHFYCPDLPQFTDSPHDHRYWFVSTVLRGSLRNKIWEIDPSEGGRPKIQRYDSCGSGEAPPRLTCEVQAKVRTEFVVQEGSQYFIPADVFHQVMAVSLPCITMIQRGPKEKKFARILEDFDTVPVCPFSKVLEEHILWDHVRSCL